MQLVVLGGNDGVRFVLLSNIGEGWKRNDGTSLSATIGMFRARYN